MAQHAGDASLRGDGSVDVESLFEPVQPALFSLQGGQPNAWADFDGDGDLDLFVGFRGQMNRLYRNDSGTFVDVAPARRPRRHQRDARRRVGRLRRRRRPRSVHRLSRGPRPCRTGCTATTAASASWTSGGRWASTSSAHRGRRRSSTTTTTATPTCSSRSAIGRTCSTATTAASTSTSAKAGSASPIRARRSASAWFDMEGDGDLDSFVANQDGDLNGFFRNDGGRFTDIAKQLGMDGAGARWCYGGVGPASSTTTTTATSISTSPTTARTRCIATTAAASSPRSRRTLGIAGDHACDDGGLGRLRQRRPAGCVRRELSRQRDARPRQAVSATTAPDVPRRHAVGRC